MRRAEKTMSGRHPEVLWAQRSRKVYLTVALPDAKDVSVSCESDGVFSFSAIGVNGDPFRLSLPLFAPIVPEGCKTNVGNRNIVCSLKKEERGWWKRILKSEEKPPPYLKVDWNRWSDEDDQRSDDESVSDDEAEYAEEDDESSDEEGMLYLPDLEKARGNYQ